MGNPLTKPFLGLALALALSLNAVPSDASQDARLNNITVASTDRFLTLSLQVDGAFTPKVTEAVLKGVPTVFSFLITLDRLRNWWPNEELADLRVTHTIKYDNLKKEFIIRRSWKSDNPVVTKSFAEAQTLMTEIRGLDIVPLGRMQKGQTYKLWAKAELSKTTLPFYLHYVFYFVTFWDFETDWHTIEFVY